jgi:SAM-dependent methyltransferase
MFDQALRGARESAYAPGEFAGQESFMRASEILALARRAGIAPGMSVLDLCCGVAGPGRLITSELGCDYVGVDLSAAAIEIARERAAGLPCRFEVREIPPVPPGPFDVALLLETLLRGVADALVAGGRFAFTLEEGRPLDASERAAMPDSDTVWLTPLDELLALLDDAGFVVRWQEDCSAAHRTIADALIEAFAAHAPDVAARLLTSHRLWSEWLHAGRVRKFAFVAEKAR